MAFTFSKNPLQIQSQKTGKTYFFARADYIPLGETAVGQIARILTGTRLQSHPL